MEPAVNLIVKALNTVRDIKDPVERFKAASALETKLNDARTASLQMKRDALDELRGPDFGYQRIANALGLTKSRIQQITKTPPVLRVYAFCDEAGDWYPEGADALPVDGQFEEGILELPEGMDGRFGGMRLTVRYGAVDADWSLWTVRVKHGDVERSVGTTLAVHNELVGIWPRMDAHREP